MKRLKVPKVMSKIMEIDEKQKKIRSIKIIDWKITSDILVVQTTEGFCTYDFIAKTGWKHLPKLEVKKEK